TPSYTLSLHDALPISSGRPPIASTSASIVQSQLIRPPPSAPRAPPHDRRRGTSRRRWSGLPHGPCRPRSACRRPAAWPPPHGSRSEEHTSELQSRENL